MSHIRMRPCLGHRIVITGLNESCATGQDGRYMYMYEEGLPRLAVTDSKEVPAAATGLNEAFLGHLSNDSLSRVLKVFLGH